jgi:hypothetical protein
MSYCAITVLSRNPVTQRCNMYICYYRNDVSTKAPEFYISNCPMFGADCVLYIA